MSYTPQQFNLPELDGISSETISEHLGLYEGYVKNLNHILQSLDFAQAKDPYAAHEMQRRLGFEFGGMRNHEYYFAQFEGGARPLPDSRLKDLLCAHYGSLDAWQAHFTTLAKTRGVGWAMLYFDRSSAQLVSTWVDEQHLGQLPDMQIVLALDMWEHSYMRDYPPSQKSAYIDAFFRNLNWETVAARVASA